MTRFIETPADGFPVLVNELFKKHGKLLITAPSFKEGSMLAGAISAFNFETVFFAPQFLLLERSGIDPDAQSAFSKIVSKTADVVITTPLSSGMVLPDTEKEKLELKAGLSYRKIGRAHV